ncbi:general odorant-binding protein 99a-like precursor [Ceratitis capitata]|uniref:Male-specific protein n=1 Tax=Ceratitis capitata TaxID=7213 RepID=P91903_CERCA|nr:general odorant-binding protein 99a-like precursor [Ceratitis capitata]CAA70152.1 male-specific protein [Ceratitis capitata]
MKYFIVILAAVVLAQAADDDWVPKTPEEFNAIRRECHKEFPFSKELQKQEDELDFSDDETVRKYEVCVFRKWGIIDADDTFHGERLVKQFEAVLDGVEGIEQKVNNCVDKNEQGSPIDVYASRIQQCIDKTDIAPKLLKVIGKL